ncbi:MAG: glycosyltransferase family 39 protein [Candidatus Omnitrophica bacterium]|nr:glycosyltransferase family 39 protein [Candidatus Omnitrophota bacterium]
MFIFPIATFLFLCLGLYRRYASRLILREAFLLAAVVWGIVLVVLTEALSASQILSFPYLSVSWIVVTVVSIGLCVFTSVDPQTGRGTLDLKKNLLAAFSKLKPLDVFLATVIVGVLCCVALAAWMAPPNNWDSLVYHMGRVPHWIQNRSVEHYPTNIKTQIYYPPFAEWVILHFQVLSGSDRFANFVQWFSMLGSAVAASLIARSFGLNLRAQLFSAFLTVTVPMGILQGSSTQNDLVLAFWLTTFVYFGLRVKDQGQVLDAFAAGGALGLAMLTKALAVILAFAFVVWFLISGIKKYRRQMIVPIVLSLSLVVALNMGHWGRNLSVCGHLLGEEEVFGMTRNERMNPTFFASNIIRNTGLHLATSVKPLNKLVERSIESFHQAIGLSSVDPANTLGITPLQISVSTHEDVAGNFIQLTLFGVALIIFMNFRDKRKSVLLRYLFVLLGTVILFNFLLKWQPAGSRLHLPVFVLMGPFVAAVLFSLPWRRDVIVYIVIGILFATSMPYVFRHSTRKLYSSKKTVFVTPRLKQYFAADDTLLPPYQNAVDLVLASGCQQVGLRLGDNSWEYPFWVLFSKSQTKNLMELQRNTLRIEHVDVVGIQPLNYPLGAFVPCAIIETGRKIPSDDRLLVDGKMFKAQLEQSPVRVYFLEK